jgi:capsular polysaccharide transport system permease protein
MMARVQIIQDGLALTEPAKPQATQGAAPDPQAAPAPNPAPPAATQPPAASPPQSAAQAAPALKAVPSPAAVPEASKPVAAASATPAPGPAVAPAPAVAAPAPNPNAKAAGAATPAPGQTAAKPAAAAVQMRPVAAAATLKRRHYGLMLSFVAVVIVPVIITMFYLFVLANDQYASRAGFTIRQENGNSASSILGGLSFLTGASQGVNAGVLHEFMQSPAMMEQVNNRFDLRAHYAQGWPKDPIYAIWPDATNEELFRFWKRVLRLSYDSASGLIDITVQALDPDSAQQIAQVILEESQLMINRLNDAQRTDSMANAERELAEAVESLRAARTALTVFRAETRIVDPIADIQGRLGVVSNLQQQLAQALVELDLLDPSTRVDDPRRAQLTRRIEVIRNRIEEERNFFGTDAGSPDDETYPEMIAQYEALSVDLEFAERNYTAALAALQAAMSNASRQSLYLAAYIPPTKAQEAEYPERFTLLALVVGFLILAWSIMALIYYSLRDRA